MRKNINLLLALFLIGGIFGFIYETLFYIIDLGYFVKRGSTYGPWIPIYGFGALLIYFLTKKINKKPALVFLISVIVCGLLEYVTGYYLFTFKHIRLWDYNTEIWNFLNIDGYICLRSVVFFGLSGLLLNYFIYPILKRIMQIKLYTIIINIFSLMFIIDILISWT